MTNGYATDMQPMSLTLQHFQIGTVDAFDSDRVGSYRPRDVISTHLYMFYLGANGDDGEVALVLSHNLIDQAFWRTDTHEPADHKARPVRDHGDGILNGNDLHGAMPDFLLGGPAAVDRQANAPDLCCRVGTQGRGYGADLFRRCKFERRLFLRE